MITRAELKESSEKALEIIKAAGIHLAETEPDKITAADFGLSRLKEEGKDDRYTMRHEVVLYPGEQLMLAPGTKHWFQAGKRGAVMYSFSSKVRDTLDQFSDPDIVRETVIVD